MGDEKERERGERMRRQWWKEEDGEERGAEGREKRRALFLSWTKTGDGRMDKFHIRVTGENLSRFDRLVLITSIPLSVMKN